MAKSNLLCKSNVYLRQPGTPIRNDLQFLRQVRGRKAVYKLLRMMHVPPAKCKYDEPEVRNLIRKGRLNNVQHNSLKWEQQCQRCNMIPSGMTFNDTLGFRCDFEDCTGRTLVARLIQLPRSVMNQTNSGIAFEEILGWAIQDCRGVPPHHTNHEYPTMTTVKVDPTIDWLYSADELSAFLVHGFLNYKKEG